MAISAMSQPVGNAPHLMHKPVTKESNAHCTCGARAFIEKQQRERARQVAPFGVIALKQERRHSSPEVDRHEQANDALPARKLSFWRKMLGKGPKCICAPVDQPPQRKVNLLSIPKEYVGCISVRVAGKRVPYTRDMQLRKRASCTPMDSITEEDADLFDN